MKSGVCVYQQFNVELVNHRIHSFLCQRACKISQDQQFTLFNHQRRGRLIGVKAHDLQSFSLYVKVK